MYSIEDLFLFVKVVEIGKFAHAAKLLKMSQSTISRRVRKLEEQLNITLIRRNSNNFEVTDAGIMLYLKLKDQVNQISQTVNVCVQDSKVPSGTLRVALPMVLSLNLITPYLPDFLIQYPEIDLVVVYVNREIDLIKDGFDMTITRFIPKQQNLKIKKIYESEIKLYCTKQYAVQYGIPQTPDELKNHLATDFLDIANNVVPNYEFIHKVSGESHIFKSNRRIAINNGIHGMALLNSNKIIVGTTSYLSDSIKDALEVLPEYFIISEKHYLVRHPNETDVKVKLFCDFVENLLNKSRN